MNLAARNAGPRTLVLWSPAPAECQGLRLLRVDPTSLKALPGRSVAVPYAAAGPTLSPDRKLGVVDAGAHGRLELVNVSRMRHAGSIRLGGAPDYAQTLAWPRRRTLVALDVHRDAHRVMLTKVVVVDPLTRRIVRQVRFGWWAALGQGTTKSGRTAVLLVSWTHLVSPRLVVVDSNGSIRQIRGSGISRRSRLRSHR
jgi:hypothetical protein